MMHISETVRGMSSPSRSQPRACTHHCPSSARHHGTRTGTLVHCCAILLSTDIITTLPRTSTSATKGSQDGSHHQIRTCPQTHGSHLQRHCCADRCLLSSAFGRGIRPNSPPSHCSLVPQTSVYTRHRAPQNSGMWDCLRPRISEFYLRYK